MGRPLCPYLKNTEVAPDGLLGFSLVSPSFFSKTQGFWKLLLAHLLFKDMLFWKRGKVLFKYRRGFKGSRRSPEHWDSSSGPQTVPLSLTEACLGEFFWPDRPMSAPSLSFPEPHTDELYLPTDQTPALASWGSLCPKLELSPCPTLVLLVCLRFYSFI